MQPGQRIGKYVLGDRIAVGGMAEVWAARAEGPEGFVKPVALKFILESFSGDPELEKLFVKEARIAAQLQHANLVAVFDFDKVVTDPERGAGGRYYIAMEHVEGHDARRVVEAAKHAGYVFPQALALYLGGEVMKGLRYVHERREKGRPLGLVHRDVSPHNVLVGFSGEVKLSDFGIAKSLAHSTRTKTGTIRGKLSYASPEQLNGEPVDQRTDQFAMGITLWEILAGRPLFDGNDEIEIVGKVMRCDIPPLALVAPERKTPAPVEAFVRKMLSARRDQRYATTKDALSALLALPGYSADGAPLGELVRTLFHRPSAGTAAGSTTSLAEPLVRAAGAQAPQRRAPHRARPPARMPGGAHDDGDLPLPSEIETRTMARASASPASGRRTPHVGRTAGTTVPVRGGARRAWAIGAAAAVVAGAVAIGLVVSGRWGAEPPVAASGPDVEPAVPALPPLVPKALPEPAPAVAVIPPRAVAVSPPVVAHPDPDPDPVGPDPHVAGEGARAAVGGTERSSAVGPPLPGRRLAAPSVLLPAPAPISPAAPARAEADPRPDEKTAAASPAPAAARKDGGMANGAPIVE